MNKRIEETISRLPADLPAGRLQVLLPLMNYIRSKKNKHESIRLNFICTHNSRRSHLSQIWAQTMAYHWGIKDVFCYSGGTDATAMFPKIVETLLHRRIITRCIS
jgi:arsenate reductase